MENVEEDRKLRDLIVRNIESEPSGNKEYYLAQIAELERNEKRAARFFSSLLEIFVHLEFEEEEARGHWARIVGHAGSLSAKLGSPVGIHMAIVDYFTNVSHLLDAPLLIEIHVFKQTERMAMVDGLTSVFNRRYMDIALKREFNRCVRYRKELSVLIVDLDNFKLLNDDRGHVFGDMALKEFARFLKDSLREEDVVCRYGGEEFLMILPETSPSGALNLAERIRRDLKEAAFFKDNGITFSGGVSSYPGSSRSAEELVVTADKALYQAKYAGKDRIVQASLDRRRWSRFPRSWELEVQRLSDGQGRKAPPAAEPCRILTQNVSLGGARFACPGSPFALDDTVSLVFREEQAGEPPFTALGKVMWVKRNADGLTAYGVCFFDLSEEASSRLGLSLPTSEDFAPDREALESPRDRGADILN